MATRTFFDTNVMSFWDALILTAATAAGCLVERDEVAVGPAGHDQPLVEGDRPLRAAALLGARARA